MRRPLCSLAALALAASAIAGCDGKDGEHDPRGDVAVATSFDAGRAMADLRGQVRIGPRPSGSRGGRREVELIVERLHAAGVAPVVVQRPYRNVVASLPGRGPGTVVVGAHHDTKDGIPGFVGANDGASGVAVLLELARVLAREPNRRAVTLVFFDAEEARGERPFELDGARGSRQFVRLARAGGRRGAPPLRRIHAIYLLDMVGDCDLQLPREAISDRALYRGLRGPAFGGEVGPILDDHVPFVEAGVPAVDVIDFSFGPGPSPGAWWHTAADSLDKVCASSLGQAGRAVLGAIATL